MVKNFRLLLSASLLLFVASCSPLKNTTPAVEIKKQKSGAPRTDAFLRNLLTQYPHYFDSLLRRNDQWKIQIIYTQVNRRPDNSPQLTHYYFNVSPQQYFYPASTVKLPAAVLSLQKLNELNLPGVDKNTTFITGAAGPGLAAVYNDPTSEDGRPTIAQYIKKIFLVSDNEAYNRLYEFLGQEYLNTSLHRMGFDSVQLLHRLQVSLDETQNRTTNPVKFYDTAGKLRYAQPLLHSRLVYQKRNTLLGNGYMKGKTLVREPFDFSQKNRFSLPDLHSVLQSVLFPETVPVNQRFNLTENDYRFLYRYMSMKPKESCYPQYDSTYTDAYGKFFLFGGSGQIQNPSLRIFNKVGDAYGFLQDVAYIVDFDKGVEFLLSATIACNSDGIFNDDQYDYDKVGFPFLKHLGEVFYNFELQRTKKKAPDLSKFRLDYSSQDE